MRRRAAVLFAALLTYPAAAHADEKDPCITAYTETQSRRKDGRLVEALREASLCAKPECPAMLAKDCHKWQTELEATIPSIVVDARSASGGEVTSLRVTVDGAAAADPSRAIPVDAGSRLVRVEASGHAPVERVVVVRDGEKNHKVAFVLARETSAAADVARPIPAGVWIFGGASVVALAVSGVFAIDGLSRKSDLDGCKPHCPAADIDAMNARFTMADVALGAGVMAGLAAVWLYVTRPRGEVPATPTAARPWLLHF